MFIHALGLLEPAVCTYNVQCKCRTIDMSTDSSLLIKMPAREPYRPCCLLFRKDTVACTGYQSITANYTPETT